MKVNSFGAIGLQASFRSAVYRPLILFGEGCARRTSNRPENKNPLKMVFELNTAERHMGLRAVHQEQCVMAPEAPGNLVALDVTTDPSGFACRVERLRSGRFERVSVCELERNRAANRLRARCGRRSVRRCSARLRPQDL